MMHELELFLSDVRLMIRQKIAFSHDCYHSAYRDVYSSIDFASVKRLLECGNGSIELPQ